MNKWGKLTLALTILFGIFLSGCANNDSEQQEQQSTSEDHLEIYTTLFPFEDFAKKIGGTYVTVESIIPPGSDAHNYEPTTQTMIQLADADLFIYSNDDMETYAKSMAESLKAEQVTVLQASEGINLLEHGHEDQGDKTTEDQHEDNEHEENHTESVENEENHTEDDEHAHEEYDKDPHVWLDPTLSIQLANNIKEQLIELKPEASETFNKNFEQLKLQLLELDSQFHKLTDTTNKRKILVSHAAYGYWEQAYGIEQISITGLSPTNEPSQRQLETIIETAKQNDLQYIIFEQNVKPKIANIIKDELGAETLQLHNLSVRTDEEISNDEDYFSIMEKNLNTLEQALK
nr:zinc ABC transporter substrate-binding protein [Bacillus solimangrovi]